MTTESLLLFAIVAFQAALLATLLLRRSPADPAMASCHSLVERQGEKLIELAHALGAAPERVQARLDPVISGFAVEQARLLAEMQAKLGDRLAGEGRVGREEQGARLDALRLATDGLTEKTAATLAAQEKAVLDRLAAEAKEARAAALAEAERTRALLDAKLKEMAETSEKRLAEIQKSVNEQLAGAVEKQMNESFQRVIDQFAAIQQMMGSVQSVASQVGDLKRLFGNIKTRGGWGEAQLKAMLDDFLPPGAYEMNVKLREDSADVVEFAILMPGGEDRARLPLDAKFPSEDYERLMHAHEAGDLVAEAQARKAIELRVRGEAAKIAQKYICPPRSTEYAILFLPTEGLYAEVARLPGVIDEIARHSRVFIAGPSLLPAMLKTIQLGYVSFALSKNAESVRELLSATKTEMAKMDTVLEKLGKQVGTVSNTIGSARTRTRAIARKLRGLETLPGEAAERLLEIDAEIEDMEQDEEV
ncbi:MAG TPA: DNA recombination protein RmuC [Roseococcus sp.]|nr:DNA recombination protein RmuC [Roseococcus sp.]